MATSPKGTVPFLAAGQPAQVTDFILQRRYRLARPFLPEGGGVLLDFGCGNGAQTELFAPDFARIEAVDINPSSLAEFSRRLERDGLAHRIRPQRYDGGTIPLDDASVDCITSFEVLEHVEDELACLRELRRLLRRDGQLILSVPNRWWLFETHGANLPLLPWNRVPFFSWLPTRIHDRFARARIYRKSDILRLLHAAGFTVQHSLYVTAPMDVVRWERPRRWLRRSLFARDSTSWPCLATAILVFARPGGEIPGNPR
ncbi:MAG: methyltransferase domain-containing protein [bacterium]